MLPSQLGTQISLYLHKHLSSSSSKLSHSRKLPEVEYPIINSHVSAIHHSKWNVFLPSDLFFYSRVEGFSSSEFSEPMLLIQVRHRNKNLGRTIQSKLYVTGTFSAAVPKLLDTRVLAISDRELSTMMQLLYIIIIMIISGYLLVESP